jgi:hypothetical protein
MVDVLVVVMVVDVVVEVDGTVCVEVGQLSHMTLHIRRTTFAIGSNPTQLFAVNSAQPTLSVAPLHVGVGVGLGVGIGVGALVVEVEVEVEVEVDVVEVVEVAVAVVIVVAEVVVTVVMLVLEVEELDVVDVVQVLHNIGQSVRSCSPAIASSVAQKDGGKLQIKGGSSFPLHFNVGVGAGVGAGVGIWVGAGVPTGGARVGVGERVRVGVAKTQHIASHFSDTYSPTLPS